MTTANSWSEWGDLVGAELLKLNADTIELINVHLKEHGFVIVHAQGVQSPQANLACVECGFPSTKPGRRLCDCCVALYSADQYAVWLTRHPEVLRRPL